MEISLFLFQGKWLLLWSLWSILLFDKHYCLKHQPLKSWWWSIYVFNSVANTKLPVIHYHWCSSTISLETCPLYQAQVWLFHDDIVQVKKKSHCLLKCSVPLPWQSNLIKTLATGAIGKLMIQTREPIPTYTLLNPVSSIWKWHFKHGVYAINFSFPRFIIL